jgi:hypothetical protein
MNSPEKSDRVAEHAELEHHDSSGSGKVHVHEHEKNLEAAPTTTKIPLPAVLQGRTPDEIAEMEKHLMRKIDFRLMPAVIIMYILNYIDR